MAIAPSCRLDAASSVDSSLVGVVRATTSGDSCVAANSAAANRIAPYQSVAGAPDDLSRMPAGMTATAPVMPGSARAWSWPRRVPRACARSTARAPTSTRRRSSAARATRTRAGTGRGVDDSSPSGSSGRCARRRRRWITSRRPPATRSISGPISGAMHEERREADDEEQQHPRAGGVEVDVEEQRVGERHDHGRVAAHHQRVGDRQPAELRGGRPACDALTPFHRVDAT